MLLDIESSLTGASWMDTLDLIKKGTCLKVGQEFFIEIWTDPWVPSTPGFRIPDEYKVNNEPVLLSELFLPKTTVWGSKHYLQPLSGLPSSQGVIM